MSTVSDFMDLLRVGSAELYAVNPERMRSGDLLPTTNAVDPGDVELFFRGVEAGLISLFRGAKFNTLDRPAENGRWSLLSRSQAGGWYNAEYLPQIAGYVAAVLDHGYPSQRVLFELPARSLQLDLAILNDAGQVVVLGEAKRSTAQLHTLRTGAVTRFGAAAPDAESKVRGDEQRQLAWRLWTLKPAYTWLIGPGQRDAFRTQINPLRLAGPSSLPPAQELDLNHEPPGPLAPPALV